MVLGGNLSEVSDPFSDLVQSVKYVLENTEKDRLILVTCLCPDEFSCNVKREDRKILVPYYATGTKSLSLSLSLNENNVNFKYHYQQVNTNSKPSMNLKDTQGSFIFEAVNHVYDLEKHNAQITKSFTLSYKCSSASTSQAVFIA